MARIWLLALSLLLVACGRAGIAGSGQAEAEPTLPAPLPRVVTTPSFAGWVAQRILAFRAGQAEPGYAGLAMTLQVMPLEAALEAAEQGQVQLVIAAALPPAGWFATPLGSETIAVVVNPDNPLTGLSLRELADLFRGRIDHWSAYADFDQPVELIVPYAGDEMRALLEQQVLEGRKPALTALLTPSPQATSQMIAERPGAIGLLPLSAVAEGMRPISLDGVAPAEAGPRQSDYPLRLTVVGYAPQEPGGAIRDWLAWLQAGGFTDSQ